MCYVTPDVNTAIREVLTKLVAQKKTFSGWNVKVLVEDKVPTAFSPHLTPPEVSVRVRELFNSGDEMFKSYACTKGPEYNGVRPLFYFYLPKNIRERIGLESPTQE